jgi:hypothetical protein
MPKERVESGPDDETRKPSRKGDEQDRKVDKALEDTFPASDPVTVGDITADEPAHARKDRKAPELDEALVDKLARELKETSKKD